MDGSMVGASRLGAVTVAPAAATSTVGPVRAPGIAAILLLVLAGCGSAAVDAPAPSFYAASPTPAEQPGTLLRTGPLGVPVAGARALRFLYVSASSGGAARVCGGMLFLPTARPPRGGRPVVAWAHPVLGANGAPSRSATPLADMEPWLDQMMARNWVVVATDYTGVGTRAQEWLDGRSEAQDLSDAVLATRQVPGAHLNGRWVAWGHSYGGHAALWAGSLASTIAPGLDLVGVAAAAPVAELVPLEHAQRMLWAPSLSAETPPPLPPGVPAFIAQGTSDTVVPAPTTALLAQQWCTAHVVLQMDWLHGVHHDDVAARASGDVVAWIAARFRGLPARSTCAQVPPVEAAVG